MILSELRSMNWLRPEAPAAAMPPLANSSRSRPEPGQPPAPRKAPPTAASKSRETTRNLKRTTSMRQKSRQLVSPGSRVLASVF